MEYKDSVSKRKYKWMWPTQWPWVRSRTLASITPDEWKSNSNYNFERHNFASRCLENEYPDVYTKSVAIQASPFVVTIVTFLDGKEISQGTGTIIEEDGTILTSVKLFIIKKVVTTNLKVIVYLWDERFYEARLLAHDFYYGIAVVKIPANVKPACLRLVNNYVSLDLSALSIHDDRLHSQDYNLVPGDKVIALGRNFIEPYDIMAAPGEFSYYIECRELFQATCLITQTGKGGPLLNRFGEVIGVASFDYNCTPFLPINVALKWWEHYKTFGKLCRPMLGMELASLYNLDLHVMEKILKKFSYNFAGVSVEEVKKGSTADIAGVRPNDIIVRCCGKPVRGFLELFDIIWDNIGKSVELGVVRARDNAHVDLVMDVVDALESNKRKREDSNSY